MTQPRNLEPVELNLAQSIKIFDEHNKHESTHANDKNSKHNNINTTTTTTNNVHSKTTVVFGCQSSSTSITSITNPQPQSPQSQLQSQLQSQPPLPLPPHHPPAPAPAPILKTTISIYKDKFEIESDSLLKIAMTTITVIGFLIAVTIENISKYQAASIVLLFFSIQWTIVILIQVSLSKNLSAIRVVNKQLPGFGFTAFPTEFTQIIDKPMESISEFAGIRGSTINLSTQLASVTGSLIIPISMLFRKIEISNNSTQIDNITNKQWIVFITSTISSMGAFLIGFFEMNNHSKFHTVLHMLGVPFVMVGQIPYGIVMEWNVIYWVLIIAGWVIFISWCLLVFFLGLGRKYPNNTKKVHKISVMFLIGEMCWINIWLLGSVVVLYYLETV